MAAARGESSHLARSRNAATTCARKSGLAKDAPAGQILVLGHLDTVYPLGTLAKMPFRVAGGRAWGPGTFDMKGGLVLALFAIDALKADGRSAAQAPRVSLEFG